MTATSPRVSIGCLALLLGVLFFSAPAEAAGKRVGVPKFEGAQEALVRKKVMQVLKAHGFDLAKSREMEIGLANTGALLDNDEGFAKVAKELALSAIVTGEIGKKRAKIAVHDGRDGSLLGDATFAGANPRKIMAEVGRDFWKKLGSAVQNGKTPSGAKKPTKVVAEAPEDDEKTPDAAGEEGEAPAPEPEPRKKAAAEPVAAAEGGEGDEEQPKKKKKKKKKTRLEGEGDVVQEEADEVIPPTFELMVGPRFINRALAYHQDQSSPGLRPYSLPAGPSIALGVVWYPLGPFMDGPLKNLGVEAGVEQGFLVSSSVPSGEKYGTSIHQFGGGIRYRMLFGEGNYFYGSVGGGEHAFLFTSTASGNRMNLDIPDVIYWYLRPGVGLHLELPADLSFGVGAGFRYVINGGGRQFHDQFFPASSVNGVDAGVVLGYRITPMFEARVMVDWRRYFSSMNCYDAAATNMNRCIRTQPDGTMVNFTVGGAVDQYFAFTAVLALTMGGTEKASSTEEAPPPPKRKRKTSEEEEAPSVETGGGDE